MTARKYNFFDIGFHGDRFLIDVVSEYLQDATHFLETGTNVGSTLSFVARNFPQVACQSCEPDIRAFDEASKHTSELANASVRNMGSVRFLNEVNDWLPAGGTGLVCWLDAHGHGFQWPLREEVEFFTRQYPQAAVFIDDFKVPGRPEFGFDQYDGQECSFEYIQSSLIGEEIELSYPTYREQTSKHHPLRGWCLIRPRGLPVRPAEAKHASVVRCSAISCN